MKQNQSTENEKNTHELPLHDKGASFKLKKKAEKFNICISIKLNPSSFQKIKTEKNKSEKTVGIYRII